MTNHFKFLKIIGGLEGNGHLSLGKFKSLWGHIYPNVKVRKIKRVSGKCWTCAYINEIRQKQKRKDVADACKHLMVMHRGGFFMLERMAYRLRVAEAVVHRPNSVMSSIIDGASQNHCSLPQAGPSVEFASPLEQHIEGVITLPEVMVLRFIVHSQQCPLIQIFQFIVC